MKKIFVFLITLILCVSLAGCTESVQVAHNISKEADNFNVTRRLTVINARTDTVLLELIGTFSLKNNSSNELEIIWEVDFIVVFINLCTAYVFNHIKCVFV